MPHLHRVARRIDITIGRAHVRIGDDAPLLPQFEARFFGERRIGNNAQRDDRHVRLDCAAARENAHLLPRLQSFKGGAEPQVDAISDQLRVQEARHIRIERRKHLPAALDERDAHAAACEIFRRLQPDEPAAHDDRRLRLLPDDVVVHGEGIFHRAQGKDAPIFRLRSGRQDGLCPGREQELIIMLLVRSARCQFAHRDHSARAVDGNRLMPDARVHAVARIEGLRRLQGQIVLVRDRAAHIIGQPAVGIGDIPRTLKHDDLGTLVKATDARRGSRTARDPSDDDNFH